MVIRGREHDAGASTRRQQRLLRTAVDFAPDAADVDVYEVRRGIVILVPDVRGKLGTAHHATRIAGEVCEKRELASGELQSLAGAPRFVAARVDDEICDRDRRREHLTATPKQRAYARQQLAEVERLDHVVVGTGIEPADAIVHAVARGEEQNRRLDFAPTELAAHRQPVEARHQDVEDDRVVFVDDGVRERLVSVIHHIDREGLLPQSAGDGIAQWGVVFSEEDTHSGREEVLPEVWRTARLVPRRARGFLGFVGRKTGG